MNPISVVDTMEVTSTKQAAETNYYFDTLSGNGFEIKRSLVPSGYRYTRSVTKHILQVNLGGTICEGSQSNNGGNAATCSPGGQIVELVSPGAAGEIEWDAQYDSLEMIFDPLLIDKLIDRNNVTFHTLSNFYDPFIKDIAIKLSQAVSERYVPKLYVQGLVAACGIHLAANYSLSDRKLFAPKGKLSARQVKSVADYVKYNVYTDISLDQLAACAHLSMFHFSRLFKNTVGVSPYQFVLQTKIDCAKKLINEKKSIGDIAYLLGFTDSAHFCNAFKRFNGYSPLRFSFL